MSAGYFICAPGKTSSAGNRMLYALRDELRRRGFAARVFDWVHPDDPSRTDARPWELDAAARVDDIAVYPEIVWGNPLGFRKVARWVLNVPGLLGGGRTYASGEAVFTWSPEYLSGVPRLRFDSVDRSLFFADPQVVRDTICTFVYKGGKCRDIPEEAGAVKITRDWPAHREELAELLRRTRVLYSFDANSSLLDEALVCGVDVRIVRPDRLDPYVPTDPFDAAVFPDEMETFVRITQALDGRDGGEGEGCYPGATRRSLRRRARLARLAYCITRAERFRMAEILLKQASVFAGERVKR